MLRPVGIGHPDGFLEGVHQHDARLLAAQGFVNAGGVAGHTKARLDLLIHGLREGLGVRDEHAGGEHIVFCLANEVIGHPHWVGGVVGDDRDLGGPASESMPTTPRTWRFAAVTKMLPGPVIMSTGSSPWASSP